MQEDKTPVCENMIERNPYDISSDEDEDNTSPVLPSLLKKAEAFDFDHNVTSTLQALLGKLKL